MRFFLTLLFVLALSIPAEAQQPKKVPRVGVLAPGTPANTEEVINLKAAKQIGLTIPQSVLYRADKVIKLQMNKARHHRELETDGEITTKD